MGECCFVVFGVLVGNTTSKDHFDLPSNCRCLKTLFVFYGAIDRFDSHLQLGDCAKTIHARTLAESRQCMSSPFADEEFANFYQIVYVVVHAATLLLLRG